MKVLCKLTLVILILNECVVKDLVVEARGGRGGRGRVRYGGGSGSGGFEVWKLVVAIVLSVGVIALIVFLVYVLCCRKKTSVPVPTVEYGKNPY